MFENRITDFVKEEQPRYRGKHLGMTALSTGELVSLITGTAYMDTANEIVRMADGDLGQLMHKTVEEITSINHIGEVGALALKAALELGRRMQAAGQPDRYQIRSPQDAVHLLAPEIQWEDREVFMVLVLDTKNKVIASERVYHGTVNTAVMRVSEVLKTAITRNAPSIILAHNHPSGDPAPSREDIAVTERTVEAGKLMDVDVLDHIIIGKGGSWASLKTRGNM